MPWQWRSVGSEDAPGAVPAADALELELRRLPGVVSVAFAEQEGAALLELGIEAGADSEALRREAVSTALRHLEGPVVVELVPAGGEDERVVAGEARVQLVLAAKVEPRGEAEVCLAYQGRRAVAAASAGDAQSVARAVIAALGQFGLGAPFEAVAVRPLEPEIGNGTLVVLRNEGTGELRRGIASGRSIEESTARAVLSALNRYLQPARGALAR